MKIVLASNNKHKVEEILHILGPGTELITPSQMGMLEDIPETGNTFVENARQKAVYLQRFTELPVLADDSGLEVTALNHEPGVFSARYAGPQKNDEDNIRLLLKNLEGKPDRTARFRTVLVLLMDDREFVFEGIITGRISTEKHGTRGFGYDPVFVPDGHEQSFAEMSPQEKNAISHRALAVQELKNFLSLQ